MSARMAACLTLLAVGPAAGSDFPAIPLSLGSCALPGTRTGEVRSVYWELQEHTEVCVNLVPEATAAGPSPFVFTFSFTHTGRDFKPPAWVLFRAQLPPHYVVVTPSLDVALDGGEPLHLVGPGQPYQVTYPPNCTFSETGCGFTGVEVPLSPETFRRLAQARRIQGTGFGIPFSLPEDARPSLCELARRMQAGE